MEEFETFAQKRKKGINKIFLSGCAILLVVIIALEIAIIAKGGGKKKKPNDNNQTQSTLSPNETATEAPEPTPYVSVFENETTIEKRFNVPAGYKRVELNANSFGAYMRTYPLKKFGEPALLYTGLVSDDASTLGVLQQKDKLLYAQQCADTAIMFYAEYLFAQNRQKDICFWFANGFKCDFVNWASGMRPEVSGPSGNTVKWVDKRGTPGVGELDYSYENLLEYLKEIYVYANTDSLVTQFEATTIQDLKPGDIIVASSYQLRQQAQKQGIETPVYGHAMIVADMAVNEAGEKVFLLVEGTTPATEPCVVEDPNKPGNVWFKFDSDGTFVKSTSGIKWQSTWIYKFD